MEAKDINNTSYKDIIAPMIAAVEAETNSEKYHNNKLFDWWLMETAASRWYQKKINKILNAGWLQPVEKLIRIQTLAINYEKDKFHNIKRSCTYLFANENKNNERRAVADFCQCLAICDFSDSQSLAQLTEKLTPPLPQLVPNFPGLGQ